MLARSRDRQAKERAMRRRQLKKLWARLAELQRMAPARDTLLLKVGAAKSQYPAALATGGSPGRKRRGSRLLAAQR